MFSGGQLILFIVAEPARATFNAFPDIADSVVVFGGGYAASVLGGLHWLHERRLVYWGDIDTHAFRILSRLRALFAHCESMLMDTPTLRLEQERIPLDILGAALVAPDRA